MKIDAYINRFLEKFFGPEDAQGNRNVWFHSQNLNEGKDGEAKGWPIEGRWWLHHKSKTLHHLSWHLWSKFCGFSVGTDQEDGGMAFHVALPPVALWWTLPIDLQKYLDTPFLVSMNERAGGHPGSHRHSKFDLIDLRFHDWTLFWEILKFDWGWSSKTPKWMSGSLNVKESVLGKEDYESRVLEEREVEVPMPEGPYKAHAKLFVSTWTPANFPLLKKSITRVEIALKQGIPFSGKGDAEYNLEEDATHGMTCPARTIEDGVGHLVASVLETRKKRGDPAKWPTYPPAMPLAENKPPPPEASA